MDPDAVAALLAVVSIGGMALVALKMVLNYRAARLSGGTDRRDVERLTDTIEQLREQIDTQRTELSELHDRVDFAERMLAKVRAPELPPGGAR